jgi:hypothetical protein
MKAVGIARYVARNLANARRSMHEEQARSSGRHHQDRGFACEIADRDDYRR